MFFFSKEEGGFFFLQNWGIEVHLVTSQIEKVSVMFMKLLRSHLCEILILKPYSHRLLAQNQKIGLGGRPGVFSVP